MCIITSPELQRNQHLAQSFFSHHFHAMGVKQSTCFLVPSPPPSPAPAPPTALSWAPAPAPTQAPAPAPSPPSPAPAPTPALAPAPISLHVPNLQFRVLIIGRANAGTTSILQRVCDTTESPEIYKSGPSGTHDLVCAHSQCHFRSHGLSRLSSTPHMRLDVHVFVSNG